MDAQSKAWQLAMALIASGKMPFDIGNPQGSIKWLNGQLQVLAALLEEPAAAGQVVELRQRRKRCLEP